MVHHRLSLPAVESARDRVAERGFVVLPAMVDSPSLELLRNATRPLPARRVKCGIPRVTWDEQTIPSWHPLFRFFTTDEIRSYVTIASSASELGGTPECWTSCYQEGEYINDHRDASGWVQLLLCMEAPPPGHGGELCMGRGRERMCVRLTPGDGVLFRASAITHATTPLRSGPDESSPRRVVGVARYFQATESSA